MKFLKFTSEKAFKTAFGKYMVEDADGNKNIPVYIEGNIAVDVVGTIQKPTGKIIETDFGPTQEMSALKGFHVNLSGDVVPDSLKKYEIEAPDTPSRVFA